MMEKFASKDEYYLSKIRESREEIARLKAEIARKDAALKHIIEYWNGGNESAVDAIEEAVYTAEQALNKPEEAGE